MPNSKASDAASEKLSTVIMDITVDAKQRLRAFRTCLTEPSFVDGAGGLHRLTKSAGIAARTAKRAADSA